MIALRGLGGYIRMIVDHAQNGTVRYRAQHPLPVVVLGGAVSRSYLDGFEERVQRDIDDGIRAGMQPDVLPQGGQKSRSGDFEIVNPRQQPGGGVEAVLVGEYFEAMGRRAKHFDHGSHLRDATASAHVSGNRTGPVRTPDRKRQAQQQHREPKLAEHQHSPPRGRPSVSVYSTAKVTEGSTICLEMLSFTLIWMR